eukprot:scaffold404496_cov17-Prasinocladus_malaysianus.AAC.2
MLQTTNACTKIVVSIGTLRRRPFRSRSDMRRQISHVGRSRSDSEPQTRSKVRSRDEDRLSQPRSDLGQAIRADG